MEAIPFEIINHIFLKVSKNVIPLMNIVTVCRRWHSWIIDVFKSRSNMPWLYENHFPAIPLIITCTEHNSVPYILDNSYPVDMYVRGIYSDTYLVHKYHLGMYVDFIAQADNVELFSKLNNQSGNIIAAFNYNAVKIILSQPVDGYEHAGLTMLYRLSMYCDDVVYDKLLSVLSNMPRFLHGHEYILYVADRIDKIDINFDDPESVKRNVRRAISFSSEKILQHIITNCPDSINISMDDLTTCNNKSIVMMVLDKVISRGKIIQYIRGLIARGCDKSLVANIIDARPDVANKVLYAAISDGSVNDPHMEPITAFDAHGLSVMFMYMIKFIHKYTVSCQIMSMVVCRAAVLDPPLVLPIHIALTEAVRIGISNLFSTLVSLIRQYDAKYHYGMIKNTFSGMNRKKDRELIASLYFNRRDHNFAHMFTGSPSLYDIIVADSNANGDSELMRREYRALSDH